MTHLFVKGILLFPSEIEYNEMEWNPRFFTIVLKILDHMKLWFLFYFIPSLHLKFSHDCFFLISSEFKYQFSHKILQYISYRNSAPTVPLLCYYSIYILCSHSHCFKHSLWILNKYFSLTICLPACLYCKARRWEL